jgi:hypothetical protein
MTEKEEIKVYIDKSSLIAINPYLTDTEITNICNQALLEQASKIKKAETFRKLYRLDKAIRQKGRNFLFMTSYPPNESSFLHFKDYKLTEEDRNSILREYPAVDWFVGFSQPWDHLHERIYKCCKKTLIFDPETETDEFINFLDDLLKEVYSDGKQRTECEKIKNIHRAECKWLDPDPKRPGSYLRTNVQIYDVCKTCGVDCIVVDRIKEIMKSFETYKHIHEFKWF